MDAPTPAPVKKSLLPNNFDLIRLFAAFQVLVYHSKWFIVNPAPRTALEAAIGTYGHEAAGAALEVGTAGTYPKLPFLLFHSFAGVPIFFVISGFLITLSFERSPSVKSYFSNRFLRIYPGLWLAVAVILVGALIAGQGPEMGGNLGEMVQWTITQAVGWFVPEPGPIKGFGHGEASNPLWTILVELEFYLMVPLFYAIGKKLGLKPTLWTLLAIGYLINRFTPEAPGPEADWWMHVLAHPAFRVYWMFVLGALVRLHFDQIRPWIEGKALWWTLAHLGLVGGIWAAGKPLGFSPAGFWGTSANPISMGVLAMAILSWAYSAKGLSEKLLKGNDLSYGIYIFNMPIICLVLEWQIPHRFSFLTVVALTFALSYLSWKFVESPALRLKKYSARKANSGSA